MPERSIWRSDEELIAYALTFYHPQGYHGPDDPTPEEWERLRELAKQARERVGVEFGS